MANPPTVDYENLHRNDDWASWRASTGREKPDVAIPPAFGPAHAVLIGAVAGLIFALNASSARLDGCSYLGGSGDESAARVAVDTAGNIYVPGTTASTEFPGTPVMDRSLGNELDAFVAKFSPDGTLIYSTLVGGTCDDQGSAIAVDDAGNAYIADRVDLCHWANLQPGVLVAKVSPTDELLCLYTFGAPLADTSQGLGIAVDAAGNA